MGTIRAVDARAASDRKARCEHSRTRRNAMKRKSVWVGLLVAALCVGFVPGHPGAWGPEPCADMAFTLRVHNQTAHTIKVISMVYELCTNRGGAVQQVEEVPSSSTLDITWSGGNYTFDSKTHVTFETLELVNAGALRIHTHVKKTYKGADLTKSHDVYLNQNLQIMAY
jgi:hypothetical protein